MKVVLFPRFLDYTLSSCRSGENGYYSPLNSFRFNFFFFILAINSCAVGGYSILISGDTSTSLFFFLLFLSFFIFRSVCRLFLSLLLLNSEIESFSSSILSNYSVFLYFFFDFLESSS